MGREEFRHVVVEERQTRCAEPLREGREVQLATQNPRFQLEDAVSLVTKAIENQLQIRHVKHGHAGLAGQLLLKTEVGSLAAKVALLQALECAAFAVEEVRSRCHTFHSIHDQIQIVELHAERLEEVCRDTAGVVRSSKVQSWAKLIGFPANFRVEPRRKNNLVDRVARQVAAERLQGDTWPSSSTVGLGGV